MAQTFPPANKTKSKLGALSLRLSGCVIWGTDADENCGKVMLCMSSLHKADPGTFVKLTPFGSYEKCLHSLRNVTEEASRSTSASGKSRSGSPSVSSEMARTVLENPAADSSNRHTSTPSLASSTYSGGGGGSVVSGGAAIAG
uniref:Uncharacterized protein n=1 Tax=Arundo donax TaxID=35708 RepID=A0A0A9DKQ9_ARUDO